MSHRVVCLGAGNMAEALVSGWLDQGVVQADELCVSDPSQERRERFSSRFGVAALEDNRAAVADAKVVVLAVKPQVLVQVLVEVRDAIRPEACLISIAAGIRTATIEAHVHPGQSVIRVMPNTPALVGRGVSALARGQHASEPDLLQAEQMMRAVGQTLRVEEGDMDAVTAVSGSGPAYLFGFTEGLIAAAIQAGLTPDQARFLAVETVTGAAELMRVSGEPPDKLREKVTSKGGTTAAALASFETSGWQKIIAQAVEAARQRSIELSAS